MNSLDDLELELRKLPGVKSAGFDERDDMLLVQLHVGDRIDSPTIRCRSTCAASSRAAHRRAHRGRDRPLATIPAAGGRAARRRRPTSPHHRRCRRPVAPVLASRSHPSPSRARARRIRPGRRARLLAVLAFPDTNELEVHLILDGRRTIGRAISTDGLIGAVQATLAPRFASSASPVRAAAAVGPPDRERRRTSAPWSSRSRRRRSPAKHPPTTASPRAPARSTPRHDPRSTRSTGVSRRSSEYRR